MALEPVRIDGQEGEGGGQVLRTALTLSLITGRPFELVNVRGKRKPPGLRPQHLACVKLAQTIGSATVQGDTVGSHHITFAPQAVRSGDFLFDVGTAGSVALLFQGVCFPLALAGGTSKLKLKGGTHVTHSPSIMDLALAWAPWMARLGFTFELELEAAGFYPEGGGEVTAVVKPAQPSKAFTCMGRGTLLEARVLSVVGGRPQVSAGELGARAARKLRAAGVLAEVETLPVRAIRSKGAAIYVVGKFEHGTSTFYELAEGKDPLAAADRVAKNFGGFMERGGAVDRHLGDQLLLPLAIAAAGLQGGTPTSGHYTTEAVTQHLLTHADVVQRFLDVRVAIRGELGEVGEVVVAPKLKLDE
ncbi:MAG: RNA 3'-phosphate cyclase [Deltaproteobacteria bacterium]|nr:RNA 3'-phosphate cyclase [Deltaproteobacteria bacterium]